MTPTAVRARASPDLLGSSLPPPRAQVALVLPPGTACRRGRKTSARPERRGRAAAPVARSGRGGQDRVGRCRGRGAGRSQAAAETSRAPHAPAQRGLGRGVDGGTLDRAATTRGARPEPLGSAPTSRYGRAGQQVPGTRSRGPGSEGAGAAGSAEQSREARQTSWHRLLPRGRPAVAAHRSRCDGGSGGKGIPGAEAWEGLGAHRQPPTKRQRSPPGPGTAAARGSSGQATGRLLAFLVMSTAAAMRTSHMYS